MPTARSTLGTQGEILAAKHLQSLGYEIIERNYRSQFGEIDIVASQNGDLVFVEVKTRRNAKFGYPSESVNVKKQQKIIRTAHHYLAERCLDEVGCRFEIAEVYLMAGQPARIEIIQNAFCDGK